MNGKPHEIFEMDGIATDHGLHLRDMSSTGDEVLYPYISSEAGIMMYETCYRNAERNDTMGLKDLRIATDSFTDAKTPLDRISVATPTEPSNSDSADVWWDFALDLLNIRQDVEHDVAKAMKQITGD